MDAFGIPTAAKLVAVDRSRTGGIGIPSSNRIANETSGSCEHCGGLDGMCLSFGNAGLATLANSKNVSGAFLICRDHASAGCQQDSRPHSMMRSRSNLARLIKSAFSKIISSRRLASSWSSRSRSMRSANAAKNPAQPSNAYLGLNKNGHAVLV